MEIIGPYALSIKNRNGDATYQIRAMTDLYSLLSRNSSASYMTYPILLTDPFGVKYIGAPEHRWENSCDEGTPFRMEHPLPDGGADYLTKEAHIFSMFQKIFDEKCNNVHVVVGWIKRSDTTGRIERLGLEYSNPTHRMRSEHTGLPIAPGDVVLIDLCLVCVG